MIHNSVGGYETPSLHTAIEGSQVCNGCMWAGFNLGSYQNDAHT